MTSIDVRPLEEGLSFGARVLGLTRADLDDDATRDRLADLFEERGVLVFEDVEPTPSMQVALSTVFGPLKDHPSNATPRAGGELGVIEIRSEADAPGVVEIDGVSLSSWLPWHFDHCYNDQLNRAGVLRAVEIVPEGGTTGFVDGIAL
jgi:taurine dioxygenase